MNSKIMKLPALYCLALSTLVSTLLLASAPAPVWAHNEKEGKADDHTIKTPDDVLGQVGFEQKLDAQIPLNAEFRDETGKAVRLGQYFGQKPVMLMLITYRCTMLCSEETNALLRSLKELKFDLGKEFDVITVSLDPRETPAIAATEKAEYIETYGRPGAAAGWHALTGKEADIKQLAQSIGFRYVYEAATNQYAHPDGVVILTPHGKAAQYYFRLNYEARDLRYGLIEASANKIGTPLDYLALLCYHYNPTTGKYSVEIMKVLRLISVGFVLIGALWIVKSTRREKRSVDPEHDASLERKVAGTKA
jgi:protein SCO1/2